MAGANELADQDIRAFNEQDLGAKLAISSPDLEFVVPGATLRGLDEASAFARALWEAFPDGRISAHTAATEGSGAAVEGTFSGTHAGTLRTPTGEIAPTGRRVELGCVIFYRVASDRIASKHFYFDRLELLTQIGASPVAVQA